MLKHRLWSTFCWNAEIIFEEFVEKFLKKNLNEFLNLCKKKSPGTASFEAICERIPEEWSREITKRVFCEISRSIPNEHTPEGNSIFIPGGIYSKLFEEVLMMKYMYELL